ncbi:hypothetical protein KC921_03130 [Candidatus Woesebacteria bacterium]|nr:hypothetical protein [Candidatus Woesebacteria bacterium]
MGKKEIVTKAREGKEIVSQVAVRLMRLAHDNPHEAELAKQIALALLLPEIELTIAAAAVVKNRWKKKKKITKT